MTDFWRGVVVASVSIGIFNIIINSFLIWVFSKNND